MNPINDKFFFLKKFLSYLVPYRIEQQSGKVTPILEVTLESGKLVLNTDKVNYSYGSLGEIFERTFKQIELTKRKVNKALILGFGVGNVASLIEKSCTGSKIIGVDFDEVVIELGKKYFSTEKIKNLTVHHADAYDFILKHKDSYDLIVVDLFVDDYTPTRFSEKIIMEAIEKNLSKNGLVCFNRFVNTEKNKAYTLELIQSITAVFKQYTLKEITINDVTSWVIICDRKNN